MWPLASRRYASRTSLSGNVAATGTSSSPLAISAASLAELTGLIAEGQLEVPVAATFPLSEVQDAYRRLASGHIRGKIVLTA